MWLTGLVAPRHVGSSQTRARTHVPCIGRQILNHCATREAPSKYFLSTIYVPGIALGIWAKSRDRNLCPLRHLFLKLVGSACCLPLQFQLGTHIQTIFHPTTGPLHVPFLCLKCSQSSLPDCLLFASSSSGKSPPTAAPHPSSQSTAGCFVILRSHSHAAFLPFPTVAQISLSAYMFICIIICLPFSHT